MVDKPTRDQEVDSTENRFGFDHEAADHGQENDEAGRATNPSERPWNLIPEAIKRGIEAGLGTFAKTDEALRGIVGEGKFPKEVSAYFLSHADEIKQAVLRIVANEVRGFLRAVNIRQELEKLLDEYAIELQIRFRKNSEMQNKASVPPTERVGFRAKPHTPDSRPPEE